MSVPNVTDSPRQGQIISGRGMAALQACMWTLRSSGPRHAAPVREVGSESR